jgi:hypothetical protein
MVREMGYLRHEAIVVSSDDSKRTLKAHEAATVIFNECGMGCLVSGLTQHAINGGAAFFVAPDGSKEGWSHSDDGDNARSRLKDKLREMRVDFIHVVIGGDDVEFAVVDSAVQEVIA